MLFIDATILRLFPPLRCAWAFRGQQAEVRITGRNAKRVLFGAINRQFRTIDEESRYAERWFLGLTERQALRKAGILAPDFWLKALL